MTAARSAGLRPATKNQPLLPSHRCSVRYTRAPPRRSWAAFQSRARQVTGIEFKDQIDENAAWNIWQSSKGALVRLCRRLFAIALVLAAACYIPFRASASPSTGTSIHTAAHVAVATDTLSKIAPNNTILPVAEPMVDTNAQLRGSVATTGADDKPSSQENSSNSGSNGKGNGWNIFGEPNEITKLTRFDEATYYFHKALTSGTLKKSFALLVLCMPVVVVLGPLYGRASDRSWARGMYLTFCTLLRVPSPVYKEKKIWAAMVLNTVFMCGLFVFAVFLGLITEDVKQRVALIKEGITPVACKHHTVVCYWNESTPALLRQISKARKGRDAFQGTVVVVADRDKFEMDQEVEQEVFLKTNERFDVETRRGSPMDVSDLQRAGVGWASTVFVMLPGQDTTVSPRGRVVPEVATLTQRNALKVSTALRVSSLRGPASEANGGQGTQEQRLVLQDCSGGVTEIGYADKFLSGYSAAEEVTQEKLGPACQPLGEHVMTSLAAQCACRPGLARVVDYLFTHDPQREQLRYMDITEENHVATYGELRRRLSGASALGYWSAAEHKTFLNPKDSAAVVPGDQMLVLSKKQPKFTPESVVSDEVVKHAQNWMSGQHRVNPKDKPKRVIVLNWMQDLDTLLQHFSDFSPAGSEIVFVHREKKFIPGRIGSVRFRQVVSNRDLDKDALMKAGFQDCDAIVYGPNLSVSNYVYDSQLISDIMVLQSWYNKEQSSARLHILAPARDPFTASVVHHVLKDFGDAQVRLQKVDPETRVSEICSLQKRSIGDSTAQPDVSDAQSESVPVVTSSGQQVNSQSTQHDSSSHKKQELPLQHVISAELYMPREFATAMMVHVSMQPKLMNILQELFDSQSGHSIWLRPAQYLHINSANDPDPVSFAWIAEAARARGETALGIITREGEVQLAPPVQQMFKFRPGDRIVVIQHQPPKKNSEIKGGLFKRRFRHKPVQ